MLYSTKYCVPAGSPGVPVENTSDTVFVDTDVVDRLIAGFASVTVEPIDAYDEHPAPHAVTKKKYVVFAANCGAYTVAVLPTVDDDAQIGYTGLLELFVDATKT